MPKRPAPPTSITQVCARCHEPKDIRAFRRYTGSEFKRNGRRVGVVCSDCRRTAIASRRRRGPLPPDGKRADRNDVVRKAVHKKHDAVLLHLATHPCVDCGENDPVVLQFDHVRGEKRFTIGQYTSRATELIMEEIAKCDVVCANCHVRRTHSRANTVRWQRRAELSIVALLL